MKPEILYEDESLWILNKPSGLLVIQDRFDPTAGFLKQALEARFKQPVFTVHRLDRETSGVICFAKTEAAHRYLSLLFQNHEVEKHYLGLVQGKPVPDSGRIEAAIAEHPAKNGKMIVARKGKPSITDYDTLESWPLYALMHFRIFTGRTHQIRVHLHSIGHPIVCDELYGDGKPFYLSTIKKKFRLSDKEEEERPLLSRLALHAQRLAFVSPEGKPIDVTAPIPKDINACVQQLRKVAPTGMQW